MSSAFNMSVTPYTECEVGFICDSEVMQPPFGDMIKYVVSVYCKNVGTSISYSVQYCNPDCLPAIQVLQKSTIKFSVDISFYII